MFVLVFELSWGLRLPEALPTVTLQLKRGLVSEDDVVEEFLLLHALHAPRKSLLFVGITNCMPEIPCCTKCLTKLIPYPHNGSCAILDILCTESLF